MSSNYISLKELVNSANTGADAIKRAPIVEEDTGLRCIRIGDISNNRPFNEWGFTRAEDKVINKFLLKKDDILVARTGNTIGVVKYIDKDLKSLYNNGLIRLKVTQNICPKYVYYNLISKNFKQYIYGISAGTSTQPNIKINHMLDYKVMDIPYNEQKAIVDILSSLDDKIELNNQMNKTLEEMAQALFKRWFVDFEFPNKEGQPYKSSGGEMVESELGLIPKGWEVKYLSDLADFQNGFAFYKVGYSENGIKVIDLGNVNALGNFVETNRDKYISLDIYNQEKMEKYKLNKDDLIIIMTDRTQEMNILGKTAKVPYSDKFILNQRVGRIRAQKDINSNYLLSAINSNRVLNDLKSKALGSVQKYVNTNHVKEIELLLPSSEIMKYYSRIIDPIYDKMLENNEENLTLTEIRDNLLPKLMSGEIRVSDFES